MRRHYKAAQKSAGTGPQGCLDHDKFFATSNKDCFFCAQTDFNFMFHSITIRCGCSQKPFVLKLRPQY